MNPTKTAQWESVMQAEDPRRLASVAGVCIDVKENSTLPPRRAADQTNGLTRSISGSRSSNPLAESRAEVCLPVDQVAQMCGVDYKTILRRIWAGDLPAFKVGSRWRVRYRDYRAWQIRNACAKPAPNRPSPEHLCSPDPNFAGFRAMVNRTGGQR